MPKGNTETNVQRKDGRAIITLTSIVPGAQIHYTLHRQMPDETAPIYQQPIVVPADRNIKVRAITIAPNKRKRAPLELVITEKEIVL